MSLACAIVSDLATTVCRSRSSTATCTDTWAGPIRVPRTLGAATVYEIYKSRHELAHGVGGPQMAVGLLVSFAVAWLVIAAFVRYLGSRGLAPFGYYRIALAVVVLAISL